MSTLRKKVIEIVMKSKEELSEVSDGDRQTHFESRTTLQLEK